MRNKSLTTSDRRQFVKALSLGGLFWHSKGAFAQALTLTPSLTLGPYYPDRMPLDLDNDLLLINNAITPAVGTIAWDHGAGGWTGADRRCVEHWLRSGRPITTEPIFIRPARL